MASGERKTARRSPRKKPRRTTQAGMAEAPGSIGSVLRRAQLHGLAHVVFHSDHPLSDADREAVEAARVAGIVVVVREPSPPDQALAG